MHKFSLFLVKLLEKHFFKLKWEHFLTFPVCTYKTANTKKHWDPLGSLDNKIKLPFWGLACVLQEIYLQALSEDYCTVFVWFLRSSVFCKRCFVILIISLSFWTHSKSACSGLRFCRFCDFFLCVWFCCYFYFDLKNCWV